jgi:hypothetical protein
MALNTNQVRQVEGQWEELIRHPDQFAGKRVRVTVISDESIAAPSLMHEIQRWLAEGNALEVSPQNVTKPDVFGDGLIEKFRKQGLVF